MKVAIVGGGIGGMALTLSLVDTGIGDVDVYESAREIGEWGLESTCSLTRERAGPSFRCIGENCSAFFIGRWSITSVGNVSIPTTLWRASHTRWRTQKAAITPAAWGEAAWGKDGLAGVRRILNSTKFKIPTLLSARIDSLGLSEALKNIQTCAVAHLYQLCRGGNLADRVADWRGVSGARNTWQPIVMVAENQTPRS